MLSNPQSLHVTAAGPLVNTCGCFLQELDFPFIARALQASQAAAAAAAGHSSEPVKDVVSLQVCARSAAVD
jgi:hypothetical protein